MKKTSNFFSGIIDRFMKSILLTIIEFFNKQIL